MTKHTYSNFVDPSDPVTLNQKVAGEKKAKALPIKHLVAVSDRPLSAKHNDLLVLVHELAHIRMEAFLRKNWDQICARLPDTLAIKTSQGKWAMSRQLLDLIHEKYAHETELLLLKTAFEKHFSHWPEFKAEFTLASQTFWNLKLNEVLVSDYTLTNPQILMLASQPLSKILRGAKSVHEVSDLYKIYGFQLDAHPTLEEMNLVMTIVRSI